MGSSRLRKRWKVVVGQLEQDIPRACMDGGRSLEGRWCLGEVMFSNCKRQDLLEEALANCTQWRGGRSIQEGH